jgi:hypothetical protein
MRDHNDVGDVAGKGLDDHLGVPGGARVRLVRGKGRDDSSVTAALELADESIPSGRALSRPMD